MLWRMKCKQPQLLQPELIAAPLLAGVLLGALVSPAAAQDTRGIETCTAQKQMERRTGCLEANVEFLQQALI